MARYDYLIIGQGIAGTVLGFKLLQQGKSIKIVDVPLEGRSSHVAAGIINPVTGRNYVKSWLIDELIPAAQACYSAMSELLGKPYLRHKNVYRALHNPKNENAWLARTGDPHYQKYISECIASPQDFKHIKLAYNHGVVDQAYQLDIATLLSDLREYFMANDRLIEHRLDFSQSTESLKWINDQEANRVIFCEGHRVVDNPLWSYLPFDPVKGEMLYVKIPDLKLKACYRHRLFLAHLKENIYWIGANYIKQYEHNDPTATEREKLAAFLDEILETPYELIEHKAGIRPAVKTRKPLLGQHPEYTDYYLFNGLGAKGSSLSPYFADMLIEHMENGEELIGEVDISKFKFY